MPDTRKKLGDFGEVLALTHLSRAGLSEVARKWRCRSGEIDLVMQDGATLVFVEVRTRRDTGAAESVDARKQSKLAALAYSYLQHHRIPAETAWRIDVVAIQIGHRGQVERLDWLQHAVEEL